LSIPGHLTSRVVAKFFFAACGGRDEKRSEDTSRSARGAAAPGPLLLLDLTTALTLQK